MFSLFDSERSIGKCSRHCYHHRMVERGPSTTSRDLTWLAVLIAIVGVVPGMLLAGVVVMIYRFFLADIVADHWIPHFEDIMLLWFPEFLRGGITAFIALGLAGLVKHEPDMRVVAWSLGAFWGGIYLLLVVIGVNITGLTMDLIGVIAYAIGFGLGVYAYLQDR